MYYQNIGLQASLRLLNNEHGCYCLLVSFLSIKSIVFLNMLYWFFSLIHTYNATSRQKHGCICIHIYMSIKRTVLKILKICLDTILICRNTLIAFQTVYFQQETQEEELTCIHLLLLFLLQLRNSNTVQWSICVVMSRDYLLPSPPKNKRCNLTM